MRRLLFSVTLCASFALATTSRAQSASNEAAAQRLFDEGRALMSESRYAEACAKFDASDKLSPAGGTLLNLGECYEKAGKPASAWAKYNEAADRAAVAHRPDAEQFARSHAKTVSSALSYVNVHVGGAVRSLRGLSVRIDGAPLAAATWGTPVPMDPGSHRIEAQASGKKTWSVNVDVVGASSTRDVQLDVLEDAPASPRSGGEPPAPERERASAHEESSGGSTQRVIGLGVAGAGVVALGVGGALALVAMTKHNGINCPNDHCVTDADKQTNDDAKQDANLATVAFIAGGVLVAGGAALFFTAPKHSPTSGLHVVPSVGARSGGMLVEGRF